MIQNHTITTPKRNHKAVRLISIDHGTPPVTLFEINESRVIIFAAQWREAATHAETRALTNVR